MTLKNKSRLAGAVMFGMLLLTACRQEETPLAGKSADQEATAAGSIVYGDDDAYLDWSGDEVTLISFQEDGIRIDGGGAVKEDGTVCITAAGSYVLSGGAEDGQVVVDASGKETVRLIFNGLDLTAQGAPINIKNAGKTVISLVPETVNILTGSKAVDPEDGLLEEADAVLYSQQDLTINGPGTLVISGNNCNGITSKEGLKLMDGILEVTAAHNGIKGKNYIGIKGGSYTITSGNDGIKSTNSLDEELGFINIEGGTFLITAAADGIQAETSLTVAGGDFEIRTGSIRDGREAVHHDDGGKGLKAGTAITLHNGTYDIDSGDDAIHSNGDVTIADGYYRIRTGDDGIHGDSNLWVSGGEIIIETCYEGLESSYMEISGGEIYINASDDGINVSGSSDQSGDGGRRSGDFGNELHITGGYIVMRSLGDGLAGCQWLDLYERWDRTD